MGNKFGYYVISRALNDVWNDTLSFWGRNAGKIKDQQFGSNDLFRTIVVKNDISMMSYGETYAMNFGFNPKDSMTYVSVEVSLSFGYGMQWLKPQGTMKKWALEIGAPPMKLVRNADKKFFDILTGIQTMQIASIQKSTDTNNRYCHQCGGENTLSDNFCKDCGTKLIMKND